MGKRPRPVVVLEYGAWADASSWAQVIERLQRAGFTVFAPPDPLRGLSSDAADLHDFLTQNPALKGKPIVLVGHSYGGAVITDAAVGDPAVKALVYVDAFIPAQGESIGQPRSRPAWMTDERAASSRSRPRSPPELTAAFSSVRAPDPLAGGPCS